MNNAGQTPKNIRITQVGEEVKRIGGEMTNYNEKLDKILSYEYEVEGCQALHSGSKCLHCNGDPCPHCKRWGGRQRTEVRSMVDKKTRQAIASLIKELVGEREYSIEIYLDDRNGTVKMKKETVKVMSPRNIFSIPIDNYRRVKVVVQELTKEEGNK